ncbi:hypothetical protein LTR10_024308 [Elasticomyces elasticus]|uniref:GST N-terminal domain-containing protein n=1 Tax=Exophiala sideris TaxID=1016849 RepID=A0ABR0JJG8_9EURO|nr:hypothetical protein LTR10_024308 [Elasticomyces elasticus]KAK5035199.1 hypothetical protein LTS07_002635 [Exophiala sideris]KAK5039449.1 hypothetical protein LTR13_003706 [Exophiala sideris]KAK5066123.1 hypothetical protein LTR69_002641 [Exophiala sideris]KAK5186800.1 hypothetical protein LTR44_000806 [Eurotiomycetes sp. CCFEE 6388]
MSSELILYDLPSKQGTGWSHNPWKTRLALNFKGISYKTEWTEYPDLQPKFEEFGISPNSTGAKYTSPAVKLPDGTYIMESRAIADALERLHPTPSLHLDSPYQSRIEKIVPDLVNSMRPIFMPLVPKTFLNKPSYDYFHATREKSLGMPLDKYAEGADESFKKAKPYIKQLGEMLTENEGPFLEGKKPVYADFVIVAMLRMQAGLGYADKIFGEEGGKELKALYEASKEWLERENH